MGNLPADAQAQSCANYFLLPVQPLQGLEHLVVTVRRYAEAVVDKAQVPVVTGQCGLNVNLKRSVMVAVLDGTGEQFPEQSLQLIPITTHHG